MFEELALGIALFSLLILLWALTQIAGLRKTIDSLKTNMDVMSTPADTLTTVATALQENIGSLSQSITTISTQAMKIETLGKKYEDTEALTRRIYNIMIGSYEKGRSGENYLRNMMNELMKIGLVRENVPIKNRIVEYGVIFHDGKLLAIDSKMVATQDIEILFDEQTSEHERAISKKNIRTGLRRKVEEVSHYIAVMAIPDSIVDLTSEIVPDAVRRNVMIVGYSAIPQLIVYFIRIHGFYAIQEDVAKLKDRLMTIQHEVSKLDDTFFTNRFERPMTMLANATLNVRQVMSSINGVLNHEQLAQLKLSDESYEPTD
jgi:hypothetical protein